MSAASTSPRVPGGPARLTAEERVFCAETLRGFAPLDDPAVDAYLHVMRIRELRRGEHFLRAGQAATEITHVLRGLLREYFVMPNGTERTKAFVPEGSGSGSLADLISGTVSLAHIVADEPSRLLVGSYRDFRALADHYPAWDRWQRTMLEWLFAKKANREYELLGLDAAARYDAFVTQYHGLEARVAARHVASYLGITSVHLSRLRRRRRVQTAARL